MKKMGQYIEIARKNNIDEVSKKEMRKLDSQRIGDLPGDKNNLYQHQAEKGETVSDGARCPSSSKDTLSSQEELSQKELDRYLWLRLCS